MNSGRKACYLSDTSIGVPNASKQTASIPSKTGGRSVTEAGVTVYVLVDFALVFDLLVLLLAARILDL
ncbi:MAG: hypothetical protein AAFV54_13395 [Pseudomonadota bacterium]